MHKNLLHIYYILSMDKQLITSIEVSTFCHPKGGAQMCRKAKFVGSSLVVGKTIATHF